MARLPSQLLDARADVEANARIAAEAKLANDIQTLSGGQICRTEALSQAREALSKCDFLVIAGYPIFRTRKPEANG